jgi:hypothetical protein
MDPYQDISKLDPETRVPNTLTVLQPGERVLCTIKRHPIGIFGIYGVCGFIVTLAVVLSFALAPGIFSDSNSSQIMVASILVSVIVSAVCAAFALVATTVYWGNSWTLTTDSLTQVDRLSLFRRQSSQLSLESLEDVTAEQNGILTRIFNYGLLKVETAGERSKFVFPFCPNPNYYAAQILAAREAFDQHTHQEEKIGQQPDPQTHQPAPPVEPPVPVQPPHPQMPPESAAALPARQPDPPAASPEIDSYEIPDGSP